MDEPDGASVTGMSEKRCLSLSFTISRSSSKLTFNGRTLLEFSFKLLAIVHIRKCVVVLEMIETPNEHCLAHVRIIRSSPVQTYHFFDINITSRSKFEAFFLRSVP